MNNREFELALNGVIVEGLKAIDASQMTPQDMIFSLEVQKSQLVQLFVMRAAQMAQKQSPIIVPRPGQNGLKG